MTRFERSLLLHVTFTVAAFWMLYQTMSAQPRATFSTTVKSPAGQPPSRSKRPTLLPPSAAPRTPDFSNRVPAAAPAAAPTPLDSFKNLKRKSLRTAAEETEFQRFYRTHSVLREAFEIVNSETPDEDRNGDAIALIQFALEDKGNPEAGFVLDEVERILFADNLAQNMSAQARRQKAANKGELMLSYLGAYPDREVKLIHSTKGTSNQQLVANVLSVAERRRQKSLAIIKNLKAGG